MCTSTSCTHYDTDLATAMDAAVTNGARVVNVSLGGATPGSSLVTAIGRAADAGVIVVISAGNEGNTNPNDLALAANGASAKHKIGRASGRERVCQYV